MLTRLFASPQVVDINTANTIFETITWALENFDAEFFKEKTQLILPSSRFFPDRADNEADMAKALKNRVLEYSGLSHWPFAIVPPSELSSTQPPLLGLNCGSRQGVGEPSANTTLDDTTSVSRIDSNGGLQIRLHNSEQAVLKLSYSPVMFKKPMDLVASMSGLVAQHYLLQSELTPPAGYESFNETSELLSVFMGFGVLMANSAYTFRGSCAKCYDPRANRSAALPEHEVVFALALFCHLKGIPLAQPKAALKPHLRSLFKKSLKQIQNSKESLEYIRSVLNKTKSVSA